MNKPYIKQLNQDGIVSNPIEGSYLHSEQNRKQRRLKPLRFMSNRRGVSITIDNSLRYIRTIQLIKLLDGSIKRIGHYVLR
jgi:hypothetical protein